MTPNTHLVCSLPKIKAKMHSTLRDVERRLNNLPDLPANVEYEVRKSLRDFSTIVKEKLKGNEFSYEFNKLADGFQECLLETKPKFTLRDASDSVIEISDDDNESSASTPSNRKRPPTQDRQPPAKRSRPSGASAGQNGVKREEAAPPPPPPPPPLPQSAPQTPRKPRLRPPFDQYQQIGSGFRTIRRIREDIKFKTKPGTVGLVPEEVYRDLCREAVEHWHLPMGSLLKATTQLLQHIVNAALDQAFSKMKRRLIFKEAKVNMKLFLDEYRDVALAFLQEIFAMDSHQMYTINKDSLDEYRKAEGRLMSRCKFLPGLLLSRYFHAREHSFSDVTEENGQEGSILTRHVADRHHMRWRAFTGADGPPFKDWERMTPEEQKAEERDMPNQIGKLGPDPFEEEIKVAACEYFP